MRQRESGNAFVYILIAVVLFAALSFILVRQEDTKEKNVLTPEQAKILATQLITTGTQIKSALDQMVFAGTNPSEMDFAKPGAFGAAPHIDKVFHPDGGGVVLPALPDAALGITTNNPSNGWQLGRFNNVEWTPTTAHDVILTARAIDREVCKELNRIITGSTAIPTLPDDLRRYLSDGAGYGYTNLDLTVAVCPSCESKVSFCVENSSQTAYSFYNVLIAR